MAQGLSQIARDRDTLGKRHVREIDGVCFADAHLIDQPLIAAPEMDLMPLPRQMHRQRCSPTTGAEDGNRSHYTLTPRRRSVPVRKRSTLDRCRNTISALAAHATTTTGTG